MVDEGAESEWPEERVRARLATLVEEAIRARSALYTADRELELDKDFMAWWTGWRGEPTVTGLGLRPGEPVTSLTNSPIIDAYMRDRRLAWQGWYAGRDALIKAMYAWLKDSPVYNPLHDPTKEDP